MKAAYLLVGLLPLTPYPATAQSNHAAMGNALCSDSMSAPPLQTVADVDGSGTVDYGDMVLMAKTIVHGQYQALYDRNGDHTLNLEDLRLLFDDFGSPSTDFDREIAVFYHRFKHLQSVTDARQLRLMDYDVVTSSLAGHGEHWGGDALVEAVLGLRDASAHAVEGLNVPQNHDRVSALFWGEAAVPLFDDPSAESGLSPLDWPDLEGEWTTKRVQAFADAPPEFTSSPDEHWHTHVGLCVTVQDLGQGPEIVLDQNTSFEECQAMPNLSKSPDQPLTFWGNFWMLHMWLYDLNANGVFANTHPCLDPGAPSEHDINDDREVPPFFQNHG